MRSAKAILSVGAILLLAENGHSQKQTPAANARAIRTIAPRQAVCDFSGIAPGSYPVSAFHDENSNGKLDTKFMGFLAKA